MGVDAWNLNLKCMEAVRYCSIKMSCKSTSWFVNRISYFTEKFALDSPHHFGGMCQRECFVLGIFSLLFLFLTCIIWTMSFSDQFKESYASHIKRCKSVSVQISKFHKFQVVWWEHLWSFSLTLQVKHLTPNV